MKMKMIEKIIKLFSFKKENKECQDDMKKYLIVCLGNVGDDYEGTRHNAGFMIGETIAEEAGVSFKSCRYGSMAIAKVKNCELMLLKPSTFMNLSGIAVKYWMNHEKLPLQNLLVLVDDLSLPFGTVRIREKGSAAGHNGLKSIEEQLGTSAYPRLKFGIGSDFQKGGQIDYVLGKFTPEERKNLLEKLNYAADAVKAFCLSGASFAMTHFNK